MLTGKEVRDMFHAANASTPAWDNLSTYDRLVYEEVASVINGSHIAPLQGLVRDFADLIDGDDLDLERIGIKRDALLKRARILCGEEPKR